MKNKVGIIVLAVLCVGLVVVLLSTKKRAAEEKRKDSDTILSLSNQWERAQGELAEQKQVNQHLEKDVADRRTELAELTNQYTQVSATLAKTEASLATARKDLATRDAKIAELESQNASLDKQSADLAAALTNLTTQIDVTRQKLASSEGDKAFLQQELKRLMAEKAELERQFNDITALRTQVAKLKTEMNISRRLEWIRKGLMGGQEKKGAQLLIEPPAAPQPASKYDLNVEVNADGSVRVIPSGTNTPAPVK